MSGPAAPAQWDFRDVSKSDKAVETRYWPAVYPALCSCKRFELLKGDVGELPRGASGPGSSEDSCY